MKNKLFTFLGTGNYGEVVYFFESADRERISYKSKFIQEALLHVFEEVEEVVIFLTKNAREGHWKNELKSIFEKSGITFKSIHIPDCKNETEIWEVFKCMYAEIEVGDHISIDITHSFRTIPLIFNSVLNYAKTMKSIEVERIVYAAYEARISDEAPILDVTALNLLTEWSFGVEQLLKTGNCTELIRNMKTEINPILSQNKGKSETDRKSVV